MPFRAEKAPFLGRMRILRTQGRAAVRVVQKYELLQYSHKDKGGKMQRSTKRVITTHAGSLPRPPT
jgi:hypothetical protein